MRVVVNCEMGLLDVAFDEIQQLRIVEALAAYHQFDIHVAYFRFSQNTIVPTPHCYRVQLRVTLRGCFSYRVVFNWSSLLLTFVTLLRCLHIFIGCIS